MTNRPADSHVEPGTISGVGAGGPSPGGTEIDAAAAAEDRVREVVETPSAALPPEAAEWLARRGWAPESIQLLGRRGSARTMRVSRADGVSAILRRASGPRAFRQELHALQEWGPALRARDELAVPRVIAAESHRHLLLLTDVPGDPVSSTGLAASGERDRFRRAGLWLRALHDVEFADADDLPVEIALHARAERACHEARDLLPVAILERVERPFRPGGLFTGSRRVPCHRDYRPDNWVDDGWRCAAIDFEHARADCPEVDFAPLWVGPCRVSRPLQEAFREGYRMTPSGADGPRAVSIPDRAGFAPRLHALAGLWAVSTVVWANRHGDAGLQVQGRLVLGL